MVLDKYQKIKNIEDKLLKSKYSEDIDVITFPYTDYNKQNNEDYYFLKVNSRKARKENLVKKIKREGNFTKLVVCGSGETDIPLIEQADFSVCLKNAPEIVKEKVDVVLDNSPDTIFKVFEKLYHTLDFENKKRHLIKKYSKNK